MAVPDVMLLNKDSSVLDALPPHTGFQLAWLLYRLGFRTISDLLCTTKAELLTAPFIGKRRIASIEEALRNLGYGLSPSGLGAVQTDTPDNVIRVDCDRWRKQR